MTESATSPLPEPTALRLCVGLTAHRDLRPAQEPQLRLQVREFFLGLRQQFPDLPLRLISALADGGDQLVAEEALALGVELLVPLPMAQAEYERDFARPEAQARFRRLLAQAARVRELPLATGNTEAAIHPRGEARNRQYAQLGMFISSHCQVLLALWDGHASEATGGTAQVVEFHLRNEMPGFSVDQAAPNLLADDESDLVFHVPCARDLAPVPADAPAPPARPRWVTAEGQVDGDAPVPLHYRHVFGQMQQFNRDLRRHARASATTHNSLLAGAPSPPPAVQEVDRLFRAADWLAVHFRRRVRLSLLCTHVLAALMGLCFILFSDIHANRLYLLAFLALFALGLAVKLVGRAREWQRKYLDYRGLAEGLRVQLFWRLAGVETPANSSLGYDSFLQKQDVDLSWIRHAMRSTSLLRDAAFEADAPWLDWVVARWVGDQAGRDGQLGYYRDGTRRRERAYRLTTLLGLLALAGGIAGALALLLGGERLPETTQQQLLLAMGLLPLLAGIREAYSYKKADKELIKQFRFMARLFASCRQRLDRSRDEREVRHLLRALGAACLEEHAEWILLHRDRPLEPSALSG
jgi:hypothetical protein